MPHIRGCQSRQCGAARCTHCITRRRGSLLYYLSHGLEEADFALKEELWALAALVVLLSIVAHGLSGAPILDRLDRKREA